MSAVPKNENIEGRNWRQEPLPPGLYLYRRKSVDGFDRKGQLVRVFLDETQTSRISFKKDLIADRWENMPANAVFTTLVRGDVKFNGGRGALLCHACRVILKEDLDDKEIRGITDLLVCKSCLARV